MRRNISEAGNVLLCALGAIVVLSLIGANVLYNCTTRLNVSSTQVRAWKDALTAAEAGGDIAFAEIRNTVPNISPAPTASPWSSPWARSGSTYTSSVVSLATNLQTQTTVETCYFDTDGTFHLGQNPNGSNWYRVRSKGTAIVPGLKRAGMDDSLLNDGRQHFAVFGSTSMEDITERGKGDSLLRKVDFKYDHFTATYGPNGDGSGKALLPVSTPQITRRIEQIVAPVSDSLFTAAITTTGSFTGVGSAGVLDSYDSNRGPYRFVATSPSDPLYPYSRQGDVQVGDSRVNVNGTIYGDLTTDGARFRRTPNVTGTIDNNVPITLQDYQMPDTTAWQYVPPGSASYQLPSSVTSGSQNLTPNSAGSSDSPNYYVISSLSGRLTINPNQVRNADGTYSPVDTYVAIRVNGGDITGGIVVNPKVHVKFYFDYDVDTQNSNIINNSPSSTNPNAANLQFYGISPPRDSDGDPVRTQEVRIRSGDPSTLAATFYAPSADFRVDGNPDFIGAVVANTFYANGNVNWHYDLQLAGIQGRLVDYRIASYVEDTR